MAIVPKRKTSKTRKRKRRSHHFLTPPILVNVNGEKVPHRFVNFYKQKDILDSDKNKKTKK